LPACSRSVRGVIGEGTQQNLFQPVHPALAHFTIIAPLVMFRAAAPIRARIKACGTSTFQKPIRTRW
jgi:hypothetical protein